MEGYLFNDWGKLPSLTPQSMLRLENAPDIMKGIISEGQKLFETAYELNVFDEQNKICTPDEEAMKNVYALIERCKGAAVSMTKPEDVAEMTKLIEALEVAEQIPMVRTQYFMSNDGYVEKLETKKSVCKDHFVSAPACQKVVKEIVGKITSLREEVESTKKMLELQREKISKKDALLHGDALFSV